MSIKPKPKKKNSIKRGTLARPNPFGNKKKHIYTGNPVGAPTLYKPEFCKELIEHMASGLSFESFSAMVGTHRDTLYEWEKKHQEFSDAHKLGVEARLLFWEVTGIKGITNKINFFNGPAYNFTMANLFGWTNKNSAELAPGKGNDSEKNLLPQVIVSLPFNGRENPDFIDVTPKSIGTSSTVKDEDGKA